MGWTPPARGPWVEKLVAFGRGLGDDGRSLVSLRPDDLLAAATRRHRARTTSVTSGFASRMDRLCTALDEEAELHLAGRIRARAELQVILQNRLRLIDLWQQEPAIDDEVVRRPDRGHRPGPVGHHPSPRAPGLRPGQPAPAALGARPHRARGGGARWPTPKARRAGRTGWPRPHAEITLMDEMVPAFTAMHENGGHLPTECIFAFAHQFSSDIFTGLYNVPSYTIWKSGIDQTPDLRVAPAHAPDPAVGHAHRAVGGEGAVTPVVACRSSSPPTPTPGWS